MYSVVMFEYGRLPATRLLNRRADRGKIRNIQKQNNMPRMFMIPKLFFVHEVFSQGILQLLFQLNGMNGSQINHFSHTIPTKAVRIFSIGRTSGQRTPPKAVNTYGKQARKHLDTKFVVKILFHSAQACT